MTKFTPQQQAFIKALSTGTSSLILEAVAGSGKTTAMVGGANALPPSTSVIACAFNRRIADTLKERMPGHVVCKTMNGLGHAAWSKHISKRPAVEGSKNFQIVKQLELFDHADILLAMRRAKQDGYVPEGAMGRPTGLVEADSQSYWSEFIEDENIETDNPGAWMRAVDEALRESIKRAWQGEIDFDDQIYMSAICKSPMQQAEIVLIDEAQDISPIQRTLLKRMARKRLIAVGDPNQAIYGFRGASYTSIDDIRKLWQAETLPLTVCFRCPKLVVLEAQVLVPHIEAAPGAPDGIVKWHGEWDASILKRGDVIISRNNKPLVSLAFKLLRKQVPCTVLGRDIGANLTRLVEKLAKRASSDDIELWRQELDAWSASEIESARRKFNEAKVQQIEDRRDTLEIFCENCKTVPELKALIKQLFSDDKGAITLSTVHKAKGLEWPRVFFLDRDSIPARFAQRESELQQEQNLAYVGITRALEELHYVSSGGLKG